LQTEVKQNYNKNPRRRKMKKVKVEDPVKELRNGLHRHRGSINEVARRADVSREFVRLVLKNERNSNTVLKVAADVGLQCRPIRFRGDRYGRHPARLSMVSQ